MIQRPLFTTVNTIVFPNHANIFIIKRDFSVQSVKEAISHYNGELIIGSQKEFGTHKPSLEQVFNTGCLCQISNYIELPDGSIKFNATAKSRFKIEEIQDSGQLRLARGNIFSNPSNTNSISSSKKEALVSRLQTLNLDIEDDEVSELSAVKNSKDDYQFIMGFSHFFKTHLLKLRELSLEEKNKGLTILDVVTNEEKIKIDEAMAKMNQILESEDYNKSLAKIEALLG